MSLASEYAAVVRAAEFSPPSFVWKQGTGSTTVFVTKGGGLNFSGPAISQAGAVALADWIHRTYGYDVEAAREEET